MKPRLCFLVLSCLAYTVGAAAGQSGAPIDKLKKDWIKAFAEGDSQALAAMYTDDAYILPVGGRAIWGTTAIAVFWRQQTAAFTKAELATIRTTHLSPTSIIEIGMLRFEPKKQNVDPDAKKKEFIGNYVALWLREKGHWKLAIDIWNSSEYSTASQ